MQSSQFTFAWTTPLLTATAEAPTHSPHFESHIYFFYFSWKSNKPNAARFVLVSGCVAYATLEEPAPSPLNVSGRHDPEFARYREHVERHRGVVYGYLSDPVYRAGFDRFRFKDGAFEFDREDAIFVLQHATPHPTAEVSEEDITSCLAQLNHCTLILDLDWNDPDAVAGYEELQWHAGKTLTDEDLEFMFRHAVPPPTMENMEACGCV
ncbi:hypothetical protein B0H16DRAFT_1724776 [Mycena metata]|uniref:Uncharacterized protein n=1 Tax=Mycena metata TaxID=1033252 RepID=A0AAD7IV80_9AGAR|nr:hypothetical protein B0H16DRAFT_1724776 [Mycena metata]